MSKKLKVGIVGCGGIANWAHLPSYKAMDNVELVAACDIIEERALKVQTEYGAKRVYTDFKEMIDKEDLDAVDICTPNYLHSIVAVYALEHGLHTFCDKPDAVSVEEVLRMRDAAEKSGKTLMVMRNYRYGAAAKIMKEYISAGKAGDIYAGRCGWIRRRGTPGKGGWFTTKAQSGGGALIDLGVHMIDLAVYLMGNPKAVAVSGSTYNKFSDDTSASDSVHSSFGEAVAGGTFDVEDLAMGFIKFDNGACLQIEFSWASNIENEKGFLELRGSKTGFNWDNGGLKMFGEEDGNLVDIVPHLHEDFGGHTLCLMHFADVVLNGATPMFVPEQGVDMIKILCGIYESARTGKEVQL